MNKTLREIISQVKIPNKFVNSDTKVTNKFIYSLLTKHRDYLVGQLDGRFQLVKLNYLFQSWRCVDLIPAPTISECCGVKTSHTIYRTKLKLPKAITASIGPIISRVSSIDGSEELFAITPGEWNRKMEDTNFQKYNKDKYYFYSDGYLYFPNLSWKKIQIEAYFEDHLEKMTNDCECDKSEDCETMLDKPFRVPEKILAVVVDNVNKEILQYFQRIQPDDTDYNKNPNRKN